MISLEIEGRKVDLPPDAKISFKLSNSLFTDDGIIPGDVSFPFDIATPEDSDTNAILFDHFDVVESVGAIKKDASIFFDDNLFRKGKIKVSQSAEKLSVNFVLGLATISDDFKSKKIKDLVNENIVISNATVAKAIFIKAGPRGGFTGDNPIKVNGRNYDGATLTALADAINVDISQPRALATVVNSGTSPNGLAAPFLKLTSTDFGGDPHALLSISESVPNSDSINNALRIWLTDFELPGYYAAFDSFFASYKTNIPATNKFRIPLGKQDILQKEAVVGGDGTATSTFFRTSNALENGTGGGNFKKNVPNNSFYQFYSFENRQYTLHPMLTLRHVFEKAATYFNISYEGDWVGTPFYNSLLIHNTAPLGFLQPFIGGNPFLFWKREFNLADLAPDYSFIDLLKALQSRYNLKIVYNAQTNNISIKSRKQIVESTTKKDISNQAGVVKSFIDDRVTGIRLQADKSEDLSDSGDYFDIGDPEITIPIKATETSSGVVDTLTGNPIGFLYSSEDKKDFSLRFVTYLFSTYPTVGVSRGLATIYTDDYRRFISNRMNRKIIEVRLSWGMAELSALDFDEKIQYDRNDYFIAFLDVELMMDDIIIMATLYKC